MKSCANHAEFLLAGRAAGPGKPFIIAEAGINHNGDLKKAYRMIDAAKTAGADCIKFQTFRTEEFVNDRKLLYTYKSRGKKVTEPMFDMFKRHEFAPSAWRNIKRYCERRGILFLSTPQNVGDLEILLRLGVKALKIGSDDFSNLPLIKAYAKTGLPLILSCGMSDMADTYSALEVAGFFKGYPVALLVCTSEYPAPAEHLNLLRLRTLAHAFPGLALGFSDHTQGEQAAAIACGLGAVIFEKHFTLSHDLPGPDHWFSSEPDELGRWVRAIRQSALMLGDGIVRPSDTELEMRKLGRRSMFVAVDVKKGQRITAACIVMKRPGTGLPPSRYQEVLGCRAARDLKAGKMLSYGDLTDENAD